ncbi:hypothetical protein AAFF_G00010290 [Aldrovandia affinis]|uniref:Uncharacterized protein n=1 Tax=Aldrovandia affinis TaxID=143900 RepID=A0AAD7R3B2_9TELE|nr:hypothetical protein AAFF_G00010290 [Aldrovandia affinis]
MYNVSDHCPSSRWRRLLHRAVTHVAGRSRILPVCWQGDGSSSTPDQRLSHPVLERFPSGQLSGSPLAFTGFPLLSDTVGSYLDDMYSRNTPFASQPSIGLLHSGAAGRDPLHLSVCIPHVLYWAL